MSNFIVWVLSALIIKTLQSFGGVALGEDGITILIGTGILSLIIDLLRIAREFTKD